MEQHLVLDASALQQVAALANPQALSVVQQLREGEVDVARERSDQLRREGAYDPATCLLLGVSWQTHPDLRLAARWFTLGVGVCVDPADRMLLGVLRHQVRQELGLPPDGIDEEYAAPADPVAPSPVPDLPQPGPPQPDPPQPDPPRQPRPRDTSAEDTSAQDPSPPVAGRRAPCPCGSGKRYKNCHGRGRPSPTAATRLLGSTYAGSDGDYHYYLDIVQDEPPTR